MKHHLKVPQKMEPIGELRHSNFKKKNAKGTNAILWFQHNLVIVLQKWDPNQISCFGKVNVLQVS